MQPMIPRRRALAALALLGLMPLAACQGEPVRVTVSVEPSGTTQPAAPSTPTVTMSPQELLRRTWESYRRDFIQDDGRIKDPMRDLATTSEGQSYALLRAIWLDDKPTFDRVLSWTNSNLRVRGDQLFGFLWGRHADGKWSMLDSNVASDADQDIALALIFAHRRWGQQQYHDQAQAILHDLWRKTVVIVGGRPYMTAGDWAASQSQPTLNPSYLAPYAYRLFAPVDPGNRWADLVPTSYDVLAAASEQPLDRTTSAYLPPNWCALDRETGRISAPNNDLDTNFGYDAFRTYWRVALDARWYAEPRAVTFLKHSDTLRRIWQKEGGISAVYQHDAVPVRLLEDVTIYGGLIGNMLIAEPALARQLYEQKLAPLFVERDGHAYWSDPSNYYLQNWLWFGVALYAAALPNLAA